MRQADVMQSECFDGHKEVLVSLKRLTYKDVTQNVAILCNYLAL